MLVLSRKRGEDLVIVIDGKVIARFTVVDIRPDKVRVGIAAESDIIIHRQEVWDAIQDDAKHKEAERRLPISGRLGAETSRDGIRRGGRCDQLDEAPESDGTRMSRDVGATGTPIDRSDSVGNV